jgi:hypothetical protein
MNLAIIGALIVMAALTVYAFIILKAAASDTGNKIRDNVIRQLECYDVLMQKKSYELTGLLKQIEDAKAAIPKRSGIRTDDGQELAGFIHLMMQICAALSFLPTTSVSGKLWYMSAVT